MQIVGPALENAKYCVESEELRNMFSKLIINSMNKDFEGAIHPSFGDVLKQLSPLDARVFTYVYQHIVNPLMHVNYKLGPGMGSKTLCKYLTCIHIASHDLIMGSLENLKRLNLVDIPSIKSYSNDNLYSDIRSSADYATFVSQPARLYGCEISEEKSLIEKTEYGLLFFKACTDIQPAVN